mgnify:CR=1 FL=1
METGWQEPDTQRPLYDLIELLFFAYRDFVGEADEVLSRFGFGRAHHRVLHFVDRNPGLRVRDLLEILKITKQSLGRVLRQLLDEGYVEARPGDSDRREKLLFTTDKGAALARRLAALQSRRIEAALGTIDPASRADVRSFLLHLVNDADRAAAAERIGSPDPGRGDGRR